MRKLFIPVLIHVLQIQSTAQQRQFDRPMQLSKCSIDIKANLFTATTFIEMEFYNDNPQEVEGLFTFKLKPEQVITAFQLDLNGKYRDGSIEEKWKARNAYNTIFGKRVDPALLTMNGIGNYSLNIYPVPAKGNRKVTMTIDQLLKTEDNELVYQLPLNVQIVKDFKLTIHAGTNENIPVVKKGLIEGKSFSFLQDQYALIWTEKNIYLQKPISFSIPLSSGTVVCRKPIGNETAFALRLKPSVKTEFEIHPQKITVFWDASSSAKKRDINKEINFLKQFVSFHKIKQLTILPFHHDLIDTAIFYTSAAFNSRWDDYLRDMKYDGATQLGKIDLRNFSSDIFFIFTDGNNTYGRPNAITGTAPVYCVRSSPEANESVLKKITGTSGGRIINLGATSMSQAISINNKGENWLMGISSSSGKTIIDQSLPVPLSKNIFLNGTMFADDDTLIIKYGYNNRVTGFQRIYLSSNIECAGKNIERIPALRRFEEMLTSYDWETILEFGLKEKMVTANTAFIVLEKVEDYIKYNITPPKDLEKQCEDMQYVKKDTRQQRQRMKLADEYEVLDRTVKAYNDKIRQWDNKAPFIELTRTEFENALTGRVETDNTFVQKQQMPSAPLGDISIGNTSASLSEVVVVGYGTQLKRSSTGSVTTVRGSDLSAGWLSVEGALAGKVAGLSVTSDQNFAPGSTSSIRIRGAGSINGSGEPL
ncbi:MAG TPA: VIT domain-containing protein, partial [Chitinophagaceae bacterium]